MEQQGSNNDKLANKDNQWTNKRVDKFVIANKVIGKGAFGVVYRGFFNDDQSKAVAVKQVDVKSIQNSNKMLELVRREISILQKLNSKYIVKLYDVARTAHYLYMFFEYCCDGDLKNYLKSKEKNHLSEKEALQFLSHISEAFRELHKKEIIHRDIKPANILLSNGVAKVSDFGFARVVETGVDKPTYLSRLGSPLYMAPQILAGDKFSSKCDVWSTGVVFYEMLYGKTPWVGEDTLKLLANIQSKQLQIPDTPVRSNQTKDLLKKMLQFVENSRLSWDEVLAHPALAKFHEDQGIPSNVPNSQNQMQKDQFSNQEQKSNYPNQDAKQQKEGKNQSLPQVQSSQNKSTQADQQALQKFGNSPVQQTQNAAQSLPSQQKTNKVESINVDEEIYQVDNKYTRNNLVAGYLKQTSDQHLVQENSLNQSHQSENQNNNYEQGTQSRQSMTEQQNDKELELIISRHLNEEKVRKGILKVNQFIQLQRNIGFFFNEVIRKLLKAHGGQKLQIQVDLYFKLLFILSKFQNIQLSQVKQTLLQNDCNPFDQELWKQYRNSQEYRISLNLIQNDLKHSETLFNGIYERAIDIIRHQNTSTQSKNVNFSQILNQNFDLNKEFKQHAKIVLTEFFETYIPIVQQSNQPLDRDVLIIVKYVLICRTAYVKFNIPNFDFHQFYEENENDLTLKQLKDEILDLYQKQQQALQ